MAVEKLKGKPLTDRQLTALPLGKDGKAKVYADGGGLYLIVRPASRGASRSFGFRGTLNGKQLPMMYIGSIKKWSLAEARAERDRCNALLKQGKDPRTVKLAKKAQDVAGPPPTINRLLNRYFETKIEPKRQHETESNRLDRIKKAQGYLNRVRDTVGKMAVADIDTEMLLEKVGVQEISKTKPPSSWELQRHLRIAFGMAVVLGWRKGCDPSNPASEEILNAVLTNEYHKRQRRKSLDYIDAPRFIADVKAYKNRGLGKADHPLATAPALLFLVYTGVRTMEVRRARWREIGWENLRWNVPAEHRKAGHKKNKVRAIPISPSMLKVLKMIKGVHPDATDDDLIFPGGSRDGKLAKGSILGFVKNSLKWDIPITVHGFRSTLHAWALAQRPPYREIFLKAQFDHVGKTSSDDDDFRRNSPSVAEVHYSHGDRPEMTDPTIDGPGARREMTDRYGAYLDSYKPPAPTA
jgi:integrase